MSRDQAPLLVHLVDGTYELFRHFYGIRRWKKDGDPPLGAVAGVVDTVLDMVEKGATHVGVATDHVIESFRNELWAGYKTGGGMEPALAAQFRPLEEALPAFGVTVWPMVELEADDGLAIAARSAAADERVDRVCIWANDKDLAQCVVGSRVVQVDRRSGDIRDADAVRAKFGVDPERIPDWLALVGDSADGYPGIPGIGPVTAASLISRHGPIEDFPPRALRGRLQDALLFKNLATLRTEPPLFDDVDELRWRGVRPEAAAWLERLNEERLMKRVERLAAWDRGEG